MNPFVLAVSLALVAPVTLLAAPGQASVASATGCAADATLEHRLLVRKAPVTTRDGRRFAVVRFFAGLRLDRAGEYTPRYCLDLVVADEFLGDRPRYQATIETNRYIGGSNGRAHTGRLDGGNKTIAEAGQRVTVTFQTSRPDASAMMTLRFPEVGQRS